MERGIGPPQNATVLSSAKLESTVLAAVTVEIQGPTVGAQRALTMSVVGTADGPSEPVKVVGPKVSGRAVGVGASVIRGIAVGVGASVVKGRSVGATIGRATGLGARTGARVFRMRPLPEDDLSERIILPPPLPPLPPLPPVGRRVLRNVGSGENENEGAGVGEGEKLVEGAAVGPKVGSGENVDVGSGDGSGENELVGDGLEEAVGARVRPFPPPFPPPLPPPILLMERILPPTPLFFSILTAVLGTVENGVFKPIVGDALVADVAGFPLSPFFLADAFSSLVS